MGVNSALQLVRDVGLDGLVRRGSDHAVDELGSQRVLPVLPELRGLLPGGGLRRGTTVGITTRGITTRGAATRGAATRVTATRGAVREEASACTTSLLLALLVEASRAGSWCAVVGLPALGVAAAAELGVALERLALVPDPGPDWPAVVAALLDGFDIVAAATGPGVVSPPLAGRLAARARQRGAVLVPCGPWPSSDLTLTATDAVWHGVEAGRGRLRGRRLTVVARGRGAATAPRSTQLWLPRPPEGSTPMADAAVHPLHRARTSRSKKEAG